MRTPEAARRLTRNVTYASLGFAVAAGAVGATVVNGVANTSTAASGTTNSSTSSTSTSTNTTSGTSVTSAQQGTTAVGGSHGS